MNERYEKLMKDTIYGCDASSVAKCASNTILQYEMHYLKYNYEVMK